MYNNGFGCYRKDNMDDGINSYFGESDINFFGDTSNDSFYGEGCGVAGIEDSSLFSESMGFSEVCGSQVINESYGTGYGYTGMFMEGTDDVSDKKDVTSGNKDDEPGLKIKQNKDGSTELVGRDSANLKKQAGAAINKCTNVRKFDDF